MNNNDNNDKNKNNEKKDKDGFSFDELQKQFQNALKNMGASANSFMIPVNKKPKEEETEKPQAKEEDDPKKILKIIKNFKLKPKEVKEYLDRFVVKQEDAKRVLSVAVCDHYNHVRGCIEKNYDNSWEYTKQNVLLLGPTGVGKTYLVKCLANLIGVPFVKADATKYSATGYVGHNVEDLVRDLVKLANGNTELAQYGIIYIDEIDKIACGTVDDNKDVSGRGVQINLLKLMEDSEVGLQSQTDMIGQFESVMDMMHGKGKNKKSTINTRNILFIVSGAFDNMSEMIKRRIEGAQIGFGKDGTVGKEKTNYLMKSTTGDFIKFGFEPEFIGRLPIRVSCEELLPKDLEKVLTDSEGSILKQYVHDFDGYDIKFNISNDAIKGISEKAYEQKTGARGLMTVMERIFRNYKFELPTVGIKNFDVDLECVKDPNKALNLILNKSKNVHTEKMKEDIKRFSEEFTEKSGFKLRFSKAVENVLIEESMGKGTTIYTLCTAKFKDYPLGLKLIVDDLPNKTLNITIKMVKNPDKELSDRIAKSYKK
ncbi:MAG: AAA domain-containing protein [bacterium]|nr:AAA domain-containing protein [bacterium]